MRPLLPYLKRYRWGFVAGVFCIFFSNGAWVFLPQVIRHAIDDLNTGVTSAKLLHFAFQLLEVAAVRGVFLFLTRWIVIGISRDIEFDLRNDLFAHLETLSVFLLPAHAHRRHYGAHDQRSERSPNAAGSGDHVLGEYTTYSPPARCRSWSHQPQARRSTRFCRCLW